MVTDRILIYDLNMIPPGMEPKQVFDFYNQCGLIVYDGERGDTPPTVIINGEHISSRIVTIDMSQIPYLEMEVL